MVGIKKTAKGIKTFLMRDEVLGQLIAAAPKALVSLFMTELGNKTWATLTGLIGNILNEKFNKKAKRKTMLRAMFTNLMMSFADPTPNQIRELKRNYQDLIAGIKSRNFHSAFGALIEEPPEIVGAIRSAMPRIGKLKLGKLSLGSFKKKLSLARPIGSPSGIKEITAKLPTRYSKVSEEDLITY